MRAEVRYIYEDHARVVIIDDAGPSEVRWELQVDAGRPSGAVPATHERVTVTRRVGGDDPQTIVDTGLGT